jgi:UDP-2,3-diacylglucosamine pyrophosphatase LpxH
MAYYYHRGHTLVVLGDAEELWEERPPTVVKTYQHSLELEAKFHAEGRYLRFWGNHDDNWRYGGQVRKFLGKIFDKDLKVYEALRIVVKEGEDDLGEFFLAHGHQGTTESDKYAWFSKFIVRYVWRPFQRFTGISLNTPAQDWFLRERHNIAMYAWAEQQQKRALIAGHTHRPVFESKSHPARIEAELKDLQAQLAAAPNKEVRRQVSEKAALLEWIRSQEGAESGPEGQIVAMSKPCYFNTGCCSFSDGDITGIEISDGHIRLIRWPTKDEQPLPQILESASLVEDVFAKL